ncbi:hypothetical protein JEZ13_00855, partial [bacterium]|nr:hypothetical protein [bacterium]
SKIESIFAEDETDITEQTFALENFNNQIDEFNLFNLGSIEYGNKKNLTVSNHYRVGNKIYKTKVNPVYLALSACLVALAWDSYSEASDLSKAIEDYEEFEEFDDIDTSELKKDRTRKNVVGTICVISSIISFTASFEQVEIKASPNSVTLGYRF